jgi:anti-sigma factor RsiW
MPACDQMRLLLGPFEDGELEPHEMQDVAFHVVSCPECKAILEEYRALGVALRDAAAIPALDGFAEAVQARIGRLRLPIRVRLGRYFDSLNQHLAAAIAIGAAAAASAVLTVALVNPVARRIVNGAAPTPQTLSAAQPPSVPAVKLAGTANPAANTKAMVDQQVDVNPPIDAGNPRAVISSLEADSPSVAVWNEPRTDTTVIWVPDQP